MVIHKRTRLTPLQRKEIVERYHSGERVCDLKRRYSVTAPKVYKALHRGRLNDYSVHLSTNKRFRCLEYSLKRLAKVERELEERLKKQARRHTKAYSGEMVHFDTKRLSLIN